jgi:hypothetical protein
MMSAAACVTITLPAGDASIKSVMHRSAARVHDRLFGSLERVVL